MDAVNLIKYKGAKAVLEALQAYPKRLFTISELAKTAKVPFSSAWRLTRRWEPAGIIESGRIGNSVTIRLRQTPYAGKVVELARLSFSPQAHTAGQLKKILKKTPSVKAAYLFGSVATGKEKPESDIDLAIWAGRRFDADALAMRTLDEFGAKTVPLVFRSEKDLKAFLEGKEHVKLT